MKIGLITDSVSHLPFEQALDLAQQLGLSSVEVATGNWSEAPHADLDALVSSEEARAEFIGKISSRGLALSALTANGNQLHPTSGKEQDQVVHDTIEVASGLGVPTVVLMSGLPGAHGDSSLTGSPHRGRQRTSTSSTTNGIRSPSHIGRNWPRSRATRV